MLCRIQPSRREVAFFGVLLSCPFFQTRSARSQQPAAKEIVLSAIREAENQTKKLSELVMSGTGPISPPQSSEFRAGEVSTVRTFLEKVHPFPNDELVPFVNPQFKPYLVLALSENVELAPAPSEVKPLPAQPVDTAPDDTLLWLLIDIVLDTLELSSYKEVVKNIANEYQPLRDVLQQIADALRLGDWQRVIRLIPTLIDVLLADQFIEFAIRMIGPELAKRLRVDILKALSKRLVPFLGVTLLGIGFVFAIRNNWERIRRFL